IAHVQEHLGDAAHPGAADPHEMDLLVLLEHHALPACWEMLSSTPVENMVMSSAEPPKETKGSGSPLVGSAPVTTPMFTGVCVASITVSPRARCAPKGSGARSPTRRPRQMSTAKRPTTAVAPTRPSSSPMMAKMKSV